MSKETRDAILAFCAQEPRGAEYKFPLGDGFDIPQIKETVILNALSQGLSVEEVEDIRAHIDTADGYELIILACRLCVLAVRRCDYELAKQGCIGLVLDDNLVDWRDVLVSLAIVEDCSCRLGGTLTETMQSVVSLATPERRKLIELDYCGRSPDHRGLAVMGLVAVADGTPEFSYQKRQ